MKVKGGGCLAVDGIHEDLQPELVSSERMGGFAQCFSNKIAAGLNACMSVANGG